jgi:hypothetical protein
VSRWSGTAFGIAVFGIAVFVIAVFVGAGIAGLVSAIVERAS